MKRRLLLLAVVLALTSAGGSSRCRITEPFPACGFVQDKDDDFDWEQLSGAEASRPGLQPPAGSYLMLVDSSGRAPGSRARLALPPLMENDTHCITFSFRMGGGDRRGGDSASSPSSSKDDGDGAAGEAGEPPQLSAYVRVNNEGLGHPVWSAARATAAANRWVRTELAVSVFWPNTYQVVFEAEISEQKASYVAIGEVHIHEYSCNEVPHFLPLMSIVEVNAGQNASVQCSLAGKMEEPEQIWLQRQHGEDVPVPVSVARSRRFTATFALRTASGDPDDRIRCVAKTRGGSSVSNLVPFRVKEPPSPVAPPLLVRVAPTTLWINLNVNSIRGEGPVLAKEVVWRATKGNWTEVYPVAAPVFKLWHLDPDTEYEIRLLLTRPGEGGTGAPGPPLVTRTRCADPKHAPQGVRVVDLRSRELTLQWEPLGYNVTRCQSFNITVCYRSWTGAAPPPPPPQQPPQQPPAANGASASGAAGAANESSLPEVCRDAGKAVSGFVLSGLPPHHNLSLQAVLYTPEGRKAGERIYTQTDEDVPGPISAVAISGVATEESISLQWREPEEPNGAITQYEVSYSALHSRDPDYVLESGSEVVLKPWSETRHLFGGLRPGTTYSFSLRASTTKGFGLETTVLFTTKISAPRLPQYESDPLLEYSDTTATVMLKPAQGRGAPISVYQLVVREEPPKKSRRAPEHPDCFLEPVSFRQARARRTPYYVSAELLPENLAGGRRFIIGDNHTYRGYWNAPLASSKVYAIYYQALALGDEELKISCLMLAKRGVHKLEVPNAEDVPNAELHSDHTMRVAGVIAGILAVLILLMGAILYIKRRRSSHSYSYYLKLAKKRKENVERSKQEMTQMVVNTMERSFPEPSLTLMDEPVSFLDTHNVTMQSFCPSPTNAVQTHGTLCRTAQPYFIQVHDDLFASIEALDENQAGFKDSGILLSSPSQPRGTGSVSGTLSRSPAAPLRPPLSEIEPGGGGGGGGIGVGGGVVPSLPDRTLPRGPPLPGREPPPPYPSPTYPGGVPARPAIRVADLLQHIGQMKSTEGCGFKEEYESFLDGQSAPWQVAKKDENRGRNRYGNIIAYDHSRVVLEPLEGKPESDYINGNYVDGYQKQRQYIATQGPLQETAVDFWRMVWQEKSSSIVMVTNLVEVGRVKCFKYWPDDTQLLGDIAVTLLHTELLAEYVIRTFSVKRKGYFDALEVRQFHFTGWPDHGVPAFATGLLSFVRRVKASNPPEAGPIITHCSAGAGRTGCYVVIDVMLEMAGREGVIDVYNCVRELRLQRVNMVQTEEQYVFIHDVLLEACLCGDTAIPAASFRSAYLELTRLDPQTHSTPLKEEFMTLNTVTPALRAEDCSIALLPRNSSKNRVKEALPPDRCLPFLLTLEGDSSNYINAALLDSYHRPSAFIVTQHPLPNTVKDFWRLVFDYHCTSVIMLNEMRPSETCPQYWPEEGSLQYGAVHVETLSCCRDGDIISRIFRIHNISRPQDGHREVQHLQYLGWPSHRDAPASPLSFLRVAGRVRRWHAELAEEEGRTLVHCLSGGGRSGTYCAVSVLCDMVKGQSVVDVFTAVKTLRNNKPDMVETLDQYRFCYYAAAEFLGQFPS
ncbi:receptor-type tyrosine-protein phosphatase mu-like isoform X1 [Lethenteron reissneri]|uniref:receptor-type tyrosine-protein phosphatase mu-like isoform X1 n=1 Tax=Lethenteron reissneri TaxID=7753 RepID=UPI002AB605D5|nr:receptor-type tyrosine-protein phosphatase mu-like isoform X1 [Lethenteron reissneri]